MKERKRKKRLDGSDSEGDEGSMKEGEQIQMGAYDSLALLGMTTCTSPSQIKGTPETEHISSELNKIELKNSTNSPLKIENINPINSSELTWSGNDIKEKDERECD